MQSEQDNNMQSEDIHENDNSHKTDEEEEADKITEMDTCNDFFRIGENYLTQTNYKIDDIQSTQESAQENIFHTGRVSDNYSNRKGVRV